MGSLEHIITSAERREGTFTSQSFRGDAAAPYECPATECARAQELAEGRGTRGSSRATSYCRCLPDDHIWSHLGKGESWARFDQPMRKMRIPASGDCSVGGRSEDRRVVVIASGG